MRLSLGKKKAEPPYLRRLGFSRNLKCANTQPLLSNELDPCLVTGALASQLQNGKRAKNKKWPVKWPAAPDREIPKMAGHMAGYL